MGEATMTEAVERLAIWLFDRYSAVSDWHGCSEHLRAEWRSDAAAILAMRSDNSTVTEAVETAIKAALDEQGGGTCISATLSTGCVWYGGLLLDVKMLAHAAILAMRSASLPSGDVVERVIHRLSNISDNDFEMLHFILNNKRRNDPAFDATCKKVSDMLDQALSKGEAPQSKEQA